MRDQRILIQHARTAGLLDQLRIKIGLPVEFYLQAVHPVIEAYAAHVLTLPRRECEPEVLFMDSLELCGLVLDVRRGRILPPNAAPEEIGERAHRWTYAVFIVALLHRALVSRAYSRATDVLPDHATAGAASDSVASTVGEPDEVPADPLLVFRRLVPSPIQVWLSADHLLTKELAICLSGEEPTQGSAIGLLIRRATDEAGHRHGKGATSCPVKNRIDTALSVCDDGDKESITVADMQTVRREPTGNTANRFMNWITDGISDGSIRINEANAAVHFVKEGMLLVSPRVFREFARRNGDDGNSTVSTDPLDKFGPGKEVQRQVLRAGWHRKAEQGNNIQSYEVIHNGQRVSVLFGVLIPNPERFISPVPAANPLLVQRVSA